MLTNNKAVHKGAFCQFLFQCIYYCHSSKSTRKETGKMNLYAVYDKSWVILKTVVLPKFYRKEFSAGSGGTAVLFA